MSWFGCQEIRSSRTNDVFPRRYLKRDIEIFPGGAWLEEFVFLVWVQHCFFEVELLQRGVAVFDDPVGGVPGGEVGAAGAAAVAGGGGEVWGC